MPEITFMQPDGSDLTVDAPAGRSVMQAAKAAGIDGIIAECGGEMVCATCHVYVLSRELLDQFPEKSMIEDEMLDFTSEPRKENSRLSCQLPVTGSVNGLVVEIPRTQV